MTDPNDVFVKYENHAKALKEANALNKAAVFDALAAPGITHVYVSFDGEGDSGQINDIAAYKGNELVPLPDQKVTLQSVSRSDNTLQAEEQSLCDAIESLCYDCLQQKHGGWEINGGAFGSFTLDVETRQIHLEFNARFIDFTTSSHAF